ncbi:MAG: hypothetical protein ABI588_11010 [Arenimonas sp.]
MLGPYGRQQQGRLHQQLAALRERGQDFPVANLAPVPVAVAIGPEGLQPGQLGSTLVNQVLQVRQVGEVFPWRDVVPLDHFCAVQFLQEPQARLAADAMVVDKHVGPDQALQGQRFGHGGKLRVGLRLVAAYAQNPRHHQRVIADRVERLDVLGHNRYPHRILQSRWSSQRLRT